MKIYKLKQDDRLKAVQEALIDLAGGGRDLPALRRLRVFLNQRRVTRKEMYAMLNYYVFEKTVSQVAEESGVYPSTMYRNIERGVTKLLETQEDLDKYQSLAQQENLSCDA